MPPDSPVEQPTQGRRSEDKHGFARVTCWIARRLSDLWDWIDKRQIDVHITAQAVIWSFMIGTYRMVEWGFQFAHDWQALIASGKQVPGTDVAAVLAAVGAPWSLLVGAVLSVVVNLYFKARQ